MVIRLIASRSGSSESLPATARPGLAAAASGCGMLSAGPG